MNTITRKEMIEMLLQSLIKTLRKRSLLSQEDFAKSLNVSIGTINRWEHGKTTPNITAMKKIKEFCEANGFDYKEIEQGWIDSDTGIENENS